MSFILPIGTCSTVTVPASSANLGPGFDSLGLALGLYDRVDATVTEFGLTVTVEGEGAGQVPTDDSHLVVVALRAALDRMQVRAPGLAVRCANRIPHARGLGSSAAAGVGGIAVATALARAGGAPRPLDEAGLVQLSAEFEGHPDNSSASVLGGAIVSWTTCAPDGPQYGARRLAVHPAVRAYAMVPGFECSTSLARGVLPPQVPHADAAFNASRAALMVVALTTDPSLLLAATEDRLHQRYRKDAMPSTYALVNALREQGVAAIVSGAGPTVLVLGDRELPVAAAAAAAAAGFSVTPLDVADGVAPLPRP